MMHSADIAPADERAVAQALDAEADLAVIRVTPQGVVAQWPSAAEGLFGYGAGDAVGMAIAALYDDEAQARGAPQADLQAAARDGRAESCGWRKGQTGRALWTRQSLTAIRGGGGDLEGFVLIARDQTALREAEEALARTQAALVESRRLEAIGRVSSGAAHNFNNLLQVIIAHGAFAQKLGGADGALSEHLRGISHAAGLASQVARELLAFSRRQRIGTKVVNAADQIRQTVRLLEKSLRSDIRVEADLPVELRAMEIDVGQFELTLLNLCVNARDAMTEGGVIRVTARNATLDDEERLVRSGALKPGAYVELCVTDTGAGIAPDVLPKIFQPFFTTKADGKGNGLGLSQVMGFARAAGGCARIESEVGIGTQVLLYLPALPDARADWCVGARQVAPPAPPALPALPGLAVRPQASPEPALRL